MTLNVYVTIINTTIQIQDTVDMIDNPHVTSCWDCWRKAIIITFYSLQ